MATCNCFRPDRNCEKCHRSLGTYVADVRHWPEWPRMVFKSQASSARIRQVTAERDEARAHAAHLRMLLHVKGVKPNGKA